MATEKKTFNIDSDVKSELEKFIADNEFSHSEAMRLMLSAAKSQMSAKSAIGVQRKKEIEHMQNLTRQIVEAFVASYNLAENAENLASSRFEEQLAKAAAEAEMAKSTIDKLNGDIVKTNEELDILRKIYADDTDKLAKEASEYKEAYEKSIEDISRANKLIERLEVDVKESKGAEGKIAELKAQIDDLKRTRYDFAEGVKDKALAEAKQAHDALIEAKNEQIGELKSTILELKAEIKDLKITK